MTAITTTQTERLVDLDDLTPLIETTTSQDPAAVYERLRARWGNVAPVLLEPGVGGVLAPRDGIYYVDGVRHRQLRRLVDDAFEGVDEHRLASITEHWCRLALDRVLAKGEADLVGEYARAVPLLVMSTMFGLEPEQARAMLSQARQAR
jgi:cytochrome P450